MENRNLNKSLIPNSQIEMMFMRICDDMQIETYMEHIENGRINLATAYASMIVTKKFFTLVEKEEDENIDKELGKRGTIK